jgi:hypothetical protein
LPLKRHGFPVYEWDGKSDTQLTVIPIETWEVKNPEKFKEKKIALMSKKEQEVRKLFIQKLSEWVADLRR